mgnify:CR=1 FL=1
MKRKLQWLGKTENLSPTKHLDTHNNSFITHIVFSPSERLLKKVMSYVLNLSGSTMRKLIIIKKTVFSLSNTLRSIVKSTKAVACLPNSYRSNLCMSSQKGINSKYSVAIIFPFHDVHFI